MSGFSSLGALLLASRKDHGWTLRDAEKATGVPNGHISQIENGAICKPSVDTLVPLAKGYGLPLARLLEACDHDWALADDAEITEHAIQMSGGGYHVRNGDPEIEGIYPLAQWIVHNQRFGGKVYRRRIIVVEDWEEVPVPVPSATGEETP